MFKNKSFYIILTVVATAFLAILGGELVEVVDAREYVIMQGILSGELRVITEPGPVAQLFDKVTIYPKRDIYEFENIKIRFSEGGEALVSGSSQYDAPADNESKLAVHIKYGSAESIKKSIIGVSVGNAIKFSGPLMTSFESYASKRNDLIGYFEDQTENGVYATKAYESRVKDAMTGEDRTISVVEILRDSSGIAMRQQASIVGQYNINTDAFMIDRIQYSDPVEKQIKGQQVRIMEVQTAIAEAKKAEQNVKTVEAQGRAEAAAAKWAQEVIKAKMVTEAQQNLEVAQLDRKTAEQFKAAEILRGQGESERKRLNMAADGALNPKLEAMVKIAQINANAIANAKSNLVPTIVMGNGAAGIGTNGSNPVMDFLNMMNVKVAKDLSLQMNIGGKTSKP